MINLLPPILYIASTYTIYKYVGNFFCLSVYIWLLHTISMFCFWVKADLFSGFPNDYTYEALSVMFFTLLLITIPLIVYEKKTARVIHFKELNPVKLKKIAKILIVISIFAICFFGINLPKVFASNIVELRDERIVFYSSSIFSKIACLGAFSSVFCLYIYFYYSALQIENKLSRWLLFSSTSFIFYTLNVAGRDGIVIWALSFLAGVFVFYRFLDRKQLKTISKVFTLVLIFIIPVLWMITSTRFSDSSRKSSGIESVFSYAGQSLPNLSYAIDHTHRIGIYSGEGIFPIALVRSLTDTDIDRFDRMELSADLGFRSNQFASYVSFFYPKYPIYILAIFISLFVLIIKGGTHSSYGKIDFAQFITVFTWCMIPIVGIFYFYYGELIGNVFLLLPFAIKKYLKK